MYIYMYIDTPPPSPPESCHFLPRISNSSPYIEAPKMLNSGPERAPRRLQESPTGLREAPKRPTGGPQKVLPVMVPEGGPGT